MQAESHEVPGLVLFRLGTATFGLPLSNVIEILPMVAVTRLPEMTGWMLGVVNLRGSHIPIIDLGRRLGVDGAPPGIGSRIIVVDTATRPTGLAVDQVTDVFIGEPDSVERLESFDRAEQPAPAIALIGAATIVILDTDSIAQGLHELHLPEGFDADL